MKTSPTVCTTALAFYLACISAPGLSLPVSEDTVSNARGVITPAAGKAATLLINTNQNALLKFDLSSLPSAISPTNISSARLKLYVTKSRDAGDLSVFPITSQWAESATADTPTPTFDSSPIGVVPSTNIQSKHFIVVDVIAGVVAVLTGGPNFGFVVQNTTGQTFIAAKEGPSQGPAAELEIDANLSQTPSGDGAFPGSLSVGGDLDLRGLMRQGSETGTSEAAGGGLIVRRIQSTNSARGSIVARTDTLTLERDGTVGGWRIVTAPNPGNVVITAIGLNANNSPLNQTIILGPNPYPATTNILFSDGQFIVHFRCSFGSPDDVGHHTDVSLIRSPNQNSPVWIGNMITTYNQ